MMIGSTEDWEEDCAAAFLIAPASSSGSSERVNMVSSVEASAWCGLSVCLSRREAFVRVN